MASSTKTTKTSKKSPTSSKRSPKRSAAPKATAEQRANRKSWIKALRSGDFKKGEGELGRIKTGYCCLGVGAKVTGTKFVSTDADSKAFADKVGLRSENGRFLLSKKLIKLIDASPEFNMPGYPSTFAKYVHPGNPYSLVEVNDVAKLPFDVIANIIESEPKELFI